MKQMGITRLTPYPQAPTEDWTLDLRRLIHGTIDGEKGNQTIIALESFIFSLLSSRAELIRSLIEEVEYNRDEYGEIIANNKAVEAAAQIVLTGKTK